MGENVKSYKYAMLAIFTLFLCVGFMAAVPYMIFPTLLNNAPKDGLSILNAYKNSILIFGGAIVVYIVAVAGVFGLFFYKAFVEKVMKRKMVMNMVTIVGLWTVLMYFMINDMGAFEHYESINSAIKQLSNGDLQYVEARIYKEAEGDELNTTRLVDVFYQFDGDDEVLYSLRTFKMDENNAASNEYTYYHLPPDVEFDYDEVPVSMSTGGSIRQSEIEAYTEQFELQDNMYRIGYTKDLEIIASIEKISK